MEMNMSEEMSYTIDEAMPEFSPDITVSVTIKDAKTNEPIEGANIYLKADRGNVVYTNQQGRADLPIKANGSDQELMITAAGYMKHARFVFFQEDVRLTVLMQRRENKGDRLQQDHELVQMAMNGDQRAYTKLLDRYRDSIYFMIQKMVNNREDADDLTIEAFGKAFQNLHKYSTDFAFSTWLYRIAINNCIDFIRRKRLDTFSLDEVHNLDDDNVPSAVRNIETDNPDPEEEIIREQRIKLIRHVLDRLKPKYRKLIELRYLKELAYEEISTETGLPLGTVKAQLFRAKELLYNILKSSHVNY
jgi:RNA polymerase sigma factor (sigma-70 family)